LIAGSISLVVTAVVFTVVVLLAPAIGSAVFLSS